jgi:hypothetical protein
MKKLVALPGVITLLFLFNSCHKELGINTNLKDNFRIARGDYYYSSAGIYDSVFFNYDADGKLIRVKGDLYSAEYGYSGENITSRQFFDEYNGSHVLLTNDTISYDGNNRISKIITWFFPNSLSTDAHQMTYIFSYSNGNINKIDETDVDFLATGPETTRYTNVFNTGASGNIESVIRLDANGNLADSIHYVYNTDPNYLKEIHPYFFLFDPFFKFHSGFIADLPFSLSRHNVIKFSYNNTLEDQVTYELDSMNHVTSIYIGGSPQMKYFYDYR